MHKKTPRLNAVHIVALLTKIMSHPVTRRTVKILKDELKMALRDRLKDANTIKTRQYNSKNSNTFRL